MTESERYKELGALTKEKDRWEESIPYVSALLNHASVKIQAKALWLLGRMGLLESPEPLYSKNCKPYSEAGRGILKATIRQIELRATLDYDFSEEKTFSYRNLSMDEIIHHLALFISRLWQIHVFGEGNTRTTAVFFIKYLRTLGFDVTNDIFAENAWYFRNSLVRTNYNDLKNGIHETTEYLELFLKIFFWGRTIRSITVHCTSAVH